MRETTRMGDLALAPALDREQLLAPPVAAALRAWPDGIRALVAPIDPDLADTAAFCQAYGVGPQVSANCVVVTGRRDGQARWGAAVVLATTRADVNGAVRKLLDVRKLSFASMDEAVAATGMEYGGITPVGLPPHWPVFVDARVAAAGPVVIGSGIRASKIVIDGALLGALPGAQVVDVARPA